MASKVPEKRLLDGTAGSTEVEPSRVTLGDTAGHHPVQESEAKAPTPCNVLFPV